MRWEIMERLFTLTTYSVLLHKSRTFAGLFLQMLCPWIAVLVQSVLDFIVTYDEAAWGIISLCPTALKLLELLE